MNTNERVKAAARLVIAQLWHDLPGEESDSKNENWEQFFRDEFADIVADHQKASRRDYKLIRWIRARAAQIYDEHLRQVYHLQSHRIGYINHLAVQIGYVIELTGADQILNAQWGNLTFVSYFDSIRQETFHGIADEVSPFYNRPTFRYWSPN